MRKAVPQINFEENAVGLLASVLWFPDFPLFSTLRSPRKISRFVYSPHLLLLR